jgi:hypothetical protein
MHDGAYDGSYDGYDGLRSSYVSNARESAPSETLRVSTDEYRFDCGPMFDDLFGNNSNQRNGEQRALPASTYFERHDSRLRSGGVLTAETRMLVDFEAQRAAALAALEASTYMDAP